MWCWWCAVYLPFIVPTGPEVCRRSRLQDLPEVALVLWCRAPFLLPALSLCACRVACRYASIWRFGGVFSAVWGFRVGLCRFGALRGFCARVELGGLEACCVFASVSILLCLYFIRFSSSSPIFRGFAFVVLGLSSCIVFVALWVCCCFFFPFGLYAQKERAQRFVPCVLACPVVCVQILVQLSKNSLAVYLAFSSSSG